jgi:hypothetical protein
MAFFQARVLPRCRPRALGLGADARGPHADDLDIEDLLDRG